MSLETRYDAFILAKSKLLEWIDGSPEMRPEGSHDADVRTYEKVLKEIRQMNHTGLETKLGTELETDITEEMRKWASRRRGNSMIKMLASRVKYGRRPTDDSSHLLSLLEKQEQEVSFLLIKKLEQEAKDLTLNSGRMCKLHHEYNESLKLSNESFQVWNRSIRQYAKSYEEYMKSASKLLKKFNGYYARPENPGLRIDNYELENAKLKIDNYNKLEDKYTNDKEKCTSARNKYSEAEKERYKLESEYNEARNGGPDQKEQTGTLRSKIKVLRQRCKILRDGENMPS